MFARAFFIGLTLFAQATFAASDDFWWGISTSSYQTEDVAVPENSPMSFKTDWDLFYEAGKIKEPRGNGTYSYTEVERDLKTLQKLGVSHYRFGIEWARVEPQPGVYNEDALKHYADLAKKLKSRGIEPIVCFWHFTFPAWGTSKTAADNGWKNATIQERWKPYIEKVVRAMGDTVQIYAPQNEPNGQALAANFLGTFPPGEKYNLSLYREQIKAAAEAYNESAEIVKRLQPNAKIMTIQNMISWTRAWWDIVGYFVKLGDEYNYGHLDLVADHTDLIGFNYYYKLKASPFHNERYDYPQGITDIALSLEKRFNKPVVVTENGVADHGDERRQAYLKSHVDRVLAAKKDGHNIKGYFYWSLVDNFEWAYGYEEKFGLFTMSPDHKTLIPKPSATIFEEYVKKGLGKPL